jgi:hypothetical protein
MCWNVSPGRRAPELRIGWSQKRFSITRQVTNHKTSLDSTRSGRERLAGLCFVGMPSHRPGAAAVACAVKENALAGENTVGDTSGWRMIPR